ncbi:unnamed protein product [Rotaria sordida]|uniref:Uncharacterized protein n=1 Tax=Rotaria sordida TaxID=392033 RepID=A0A819E1J7_9BILA|nr:unnamed protein product [Rotaria sordida]CAF3842818.1 unnamed protein product [Rotaria sordida]
MLQYALPLTMSKNRDKIPPPRPPSVPSSTIENNLEINQMMECYGDDDHLSQSSSTTNQGDQQNNNNNIRSTRS